MFWAFWETDNALFHGETGETHLLKEMPLSVMQLLSESPRTIEDLYALTATSCGIIVDAQWRRNVDGVLRSLANLELVEQVHSARP